MPRPLPVLIPLILVGLVTVGSLHAESYSDSSGFSCRGPDGWEVLSASRVGEVEGALSPSAQAWVRNNGIDFSQIKVILLRNGDPQGFLENINVVVESGQVLVTEAMRSRLATVVPNKFTEAGLKVADFQNRIATINGRATIVSDYSVTFPSSMENITVRQRQFSVPGGGKTFTVTCTALPDTFDTHEAVFNRFAETFEVPEPNVSGFDWGAVLKSGAIWGVLGGLIGGLVGARSFLARKKQSSPPDKG